MILLAYSTFKLHSQTVINTESNLNKIDSIDKNGFKASKISILYEAQLGLNGIESALDSMVLEIERKISSGVNLIILSDKGVSPSLAPIPVLLATSHVQNCFKRLKKRSEFGIIIESAEPREPHHFALLFGYGASAINPYMVNEIISHQIKNKVIQNVSIEKGIDNFNKAIAKGLSLIHI